MLAFCFHDLIDPVSVFSDNLTEMISRSLLPLSIASLIYPQDTASLPTIVLIL